MTDTQTPEVVAAILKDVTWVRNNVAALAADRDAQKARADAAEAKVAKLVEALTLAANRLSRRAVEYVPGSRLFIETGEWADEARAIIAEVQG